MIDITLLQVPQPSNIYPLGLACLSAVVKDRTSYSVERLYPLELETRDNFSLASRRTPEVYYIVGMEAFPFILAACKEYREKGFISGEIFKNDTFARIIGSVYACPVELPKVISSFARQAEEWVKKQHWGKIAGFSVIESCSFSTALASLFLREHSPDTEIVYGGAAITKNRYLRELFLKQGLCDTCIVSEGEVVFPELSELLIEYPKRDSGYYDRLSELPNLAYLENGKKYRETGVRLVEDLDSLPTPDLSDYWDWYGKGVRLLGTGHTREFSAVVRPLVPVYASRGCTNRCVFCSEWDLFGWRFRKRSPSRVVDDLEHYKENYGLWRFLFTDCLLDWGTQKWLKTFCSELIDRNVNVTWSGHVTGKPTSYETISLLREAGCVLFWIGLETVSDKGLKKLGKDKSLQDSTSRLETMCNYLDGGIAVKINLMFGPESQTLVNVSNFVRKIDKWLDAGRTVNLASVQLLDVRPGNAFFHSLRPEQFITFHQLFPGLRGITGESEFLHVPAATNGAGLDHPLWKLLTWELLVTHEKLFLNRKFHEKLDKLLVKELTGKIYPAGEAKTMYPVFHGETTVRSSQNGLSARDWEPAINIGGRKKKLSNDEITLLKGMKGKKNLGDLLEEVKENKNGMIFEELLYPLTVYGLIQWNTHDNSRYTGNLRLENNSLAFSTKISEKF